MKVHASEQERVGIRNPNHIAARRAAGSIRHATGGATDSPRTGLCSTILPTVRSTGTWTPPALPYLTFRGWAAFPVSSWPESSGLGARARPCKTGGIGKGSSKASRAGWRPRPARTERAPRLQQCRSSATRRCTGGGAGAQRTRGHTRGPAGRKTVF